MGSYVLLTLAEQEASLSKGTVQKGRSVKISVTKGVQDTLLGHGNRDLSCKLYSALGWRSY